MAAAVVVLHLPQGRAHRWSAIATGTEGLKGRSEAMRQTGELPFARTADLAFRFGYRAIRFGGSPWPDSLPDVIVSRKMGLVCAGIPLCGTMTLKRFFRSNPQVDFEAELLRDTIPNVLRSKLDGETRLLFSVVRNPWSRVVSCYEKKIRGAYIKRSYRGYKGIALIAGYDGLRPDMPFDAFVEWLCDVRGQDDVANRHWMSQHRFLSLSEVGTEYKKILRLESMEADLNSVLSDLGLPYQPLEKMNSSSTKAPGRLYATTKDYYKTRAINAVGDRYARDIELFGYDFG